MVDGMHDAVSRMGRVDSVFANAGIGSAVPSFTEITAEAFRKVVAVNQEVCSSPCAKRQST